jgi:hypothetical protein
MEPNDMENMEPDDMEPNDMENMEPDWSRAT